eukprot:1159714-Pelagomonas_calceolata.AAC.1
MFEHVESVYVCIASKYNFCLEDSSASQEPTQQQQLSSFTALPKTGRNSHHFLAHNAVQLHFSLPSSGLCCSMAGGFPVRDLVEVGVSPSLIQRLGCKLLA